MYFLETVGEMSESAWVPESAILPFKGGHEFKDLPVLRRRGKQKEKDYKYTVNNSNKLREKNVDPWSYALQLSFLLPDTQKPSDSVEG